MKFIPTLNSYVFTFHVNSSSLFNFSQHANLTIAVQRVVNAFAPLYNAKLIQPKEFIRLVYRFVAESMLETVGEFAPVNLRGTVSKLPNMDPSDPLREDANNPV